MAPQEPIFPDEVVAGPPVDPDKHPLARTIWTAVISALVVVVLVGVFLLLSFLFRDTRTEMTRITIDGPQLSVVAGDADVRFVEGSGERVVARSRITSGLFETSVDIEQRRGDLVVDSGCRPVITPACSVSVTFEVPKGLPVEVRTTSGDVEARGLSERVLTARTTSGDIEGDALAVTELNAQSDSGDVDAKFARQPFAFKARTTSGDVSADIPAGSVDYQVRASSESGDVETSLDDVPDGQGFVGVQTDSGDVELNR